MERKYLPIHEKLEERISYTFKEKEFLLLALTHSTYAYEHRKFGVISNQRLEFLGDAILDFIVGEEMYNRMSDWDEGMLSKTRALVGKGEEATGGREKISTLADTMESLFAAIYLDDGFESAKKVVLSCLRPYIELALKGELIFDYKSRLLEKAQIKSDPHQVSFEVVREEGPVHDRVFEVAVKIDDQEIVRAEGRSKKQAEQEASRLALSIWKA